jgi:hypothetical protein
VTQMSVDAAACPECATPMSEMGSMPSIRKQSSWRFLMCPRCGKVVKEYCEAEPSPNLDRT